MLLNIDPMMLLSYASLDEDPMCGSTLINLQLTMKCSYTVIISVDHGLLFYLPCQISADEFLAFPNPYNSGLVFHDNELRMDVPDFEAGYQRAYCTFWETHFLYKISCREGKAVGLYKG